MRCVYVSLVLLLSCGSIAVAGFWGNEALVDSGAVTAFDLSTDTSGRIWVAVAYPDQAVGLYFSEDYGLTWRGHWAMRADSAIRQLQLLTGEGDSSFLYLFMLQAGHDGDLWLARVGMRSSDYLLLPVAVGPDTIDDFSATLDRDGDYYLYCLYANEHRTGRTGSFVRSPDFGKSWESGTDWWNAWDPCISYTSGSTIHCVWRYALASEVHYSYNRHYGASGYWLPYRRVSGEVDQCFDPVVVQSDTSAEYRAGAWVWYTVGQRGAEILDLQGWVSWDGGWSWNPGITLGDPLLDESSPALAADRTGPNGYVGLCYRSNGRRPDDTASLFLTCANARDLNDWLKPVKVNHSPVAREPGVAPKLVYVPRAPLRMPGVLYSQATDSGPSGVRFTAAWLTDSDPRELEDLYLGCRPNPARSAVRVSADAARSGSYTVAVYGADGRMVAELFRGWLEPGLHAWSWDRMAAARLRAPAGAYFVRLTGPGLCIRKKLVLL